MPHTVNTGFVDVFRPETIVCNLPSRTRDDALAALLRLLEEETPGRDPQVMLDELIAREALAPTVVYPGIAVPHLRLEGLSRLLVAVGTSVPGIPFNGDAQHPVHAIFLVLTPKSMPDAYLQFLAGLSKKMIALKDVRLIAGCPSPDELCAMLTSGKDDFPPFVSAMHMMAHNPATLLESDHLGTAIDLFCERRLYDIPVVDEQGDVRGVVSLEDLLQISLPEHLLWMHDLTPIIQFEPFADLLRKDRTMRLADFMREEYISVPPDVPAIQLAKIFLMEKTRQILVMEGRHLAGVVNLHSFISKLFWA